MSAFVLPAQVAGAGAQGWGLSDWSSVRLSATADATGTATIDCGQVDPATQWLVDRVVIQAPTPPPPAGQTVGTPPVFRLYESSVAPVNLLDGTANGGQNSNDYPQGLLVRPSRSLVGQWTGTTAGGVCTLTAQVRVYRRVG